MPDSFSDRGIIVKIIDFGEADKLVFILTENHGLQELIAKGARRANSRKSSHLDLLNLIKFQTSRGMAMKLMLQAETLEFFPKLKTDLRSIKVALLVCELLLNLLGVGQDDRPLFVSFYKFLKAVNDNGSDNSLEAQFCLYCLRHLGYPLPPEGKQVDLINYLESLISRKMVSSQIS